MAPTVREELRRAHEALDALRQDQAAEAEALAAGYGELGHVLLAAGQFGAAKLCYDNAASLAPTDSRWPYFVAHVYRNQGDWEQAARSFNDALQMSPDYVPARVWLGEMALAAGWVELAELTFTAALSWDERHSAALFGMGRTALERREYAKAAGYLERALAADPRASAIRYPLAMAYRGNGDATTADLHLRLRGPVQPAMADPLMEEIERIRRDRFRLPPGPDAGRGSPSPAAPEPSHASFSPVRMR
jgi:tetratricopeptide (TPR) repeat protein